MGLINDVAVLRGNCIVVYTDFSQFRKSKGNSPLSVNSISNLKKGKEGHYNGYMSPATARACKKYINCFLLGIKYSGKKNTLPTFTTLTLPAKQKHDDNYIKREMFGRFMEAAKNKWKVEHYFWRAEPQKNGNIHFHVLTDKRISWRGIRNVWNYYCKKHGYIDDYRNEQKNWHQGGFKPRLDLAKPSTDKTGAKLKGWSISSQKKAYDRGVKTNWSDPNSTDIHRLKKINNVGAYVTKYMCKNANEVQVIADLNLKLSKSSISDQEKLAIEARIKVLSSKYRKIDGRIWGASDSLRNLTYFKEVIQTRTTDGNCVDGSPEMMTYLDSIASEPNLKFEQINDYLRVMMLEKPQSHYLRKHMPFLGKCYQNHYSMMYKSNHYANV